MVYLHAVKKGKPVGPRDVMKPMSLSTQRCVWAPVINSKTYYLQKNEYGEYTIKGKAHVKSYVWLSKRLIPKLL